MSIVVGVQSHAYRGAQARGRQGAQICIPWPLRAGEWKVQLAGYRLLVVAWWCCCCKTNIQLPDCIDNRHAANEPQGFYLQLQAMLDVLFPFDGTYFFSWTALE